MKSNSAYYIHIYTHIIDILVGWIFDASFTNYFSCKYLISSELCERENTSEKNNDIYKAFRLCKYIYLLSWTTDVTKMSLLPIFSFLNISKS